MRHLSNLLALCALTLCFFFGGGLECEAAQVTRKDKVTAVNKARSPNFSSKWWKSKKRSLIIIDAGHGGEDYGTYSNTKPRNHEKYLTLATAKMLRDHLKRMGYKVVMTRESDEFISLPKRMNLTEKYRSTLFVSVHYNSAPNKTAHGVEVFYYNSKEDQNRTVASQKLAQSILKTVIQETKANSRGVKHGNFMVIRETKIPAILIEGGFLTNSDELRKLKNPNYLNHIAKGIAAGVDNYLKG